MSRLPPHRRIYRRQKGKTILFGAAVLIFAVLFVVWTDKALRWSPHDQEVLDQIEN